jgi:hypothetical protein
LLQEQGCPACRYVEEAERSFFSWFEIESFSTAEMQAALRAAMGMCAAHARRLIEDTGEGHIATTVVRHAVAGARERLNGENPCGPCPACHAVRSATERAIRLLLDGLLDSAHADLYAEHTGMCVPHVGEAVKTAAEPVALKVVAQRLSDSLSTADDSALVELLAGVDRDRERRRKWRRELPEHLGTASTEGDVCARLAIETCPICLSIGWSERRYVEWFVERSQEHDPSIRTDPGELCAVHLTDVALVDQAVAAEAGRENRAARLRELQRLRNNLSELRTAGRRDRRARFDDLDKALAEFVSEHHCPACHARNEIELSQLALLTASIALPSVRERYVHSHGLCVHHTMSAGDGQGARVIKQHADARLAMLGWELQETARKYAWACRHEPIGPERDAWLRAVVQVDGRVFEGCPAPAESG